jgi:hypothetical protein
MLLRIFASAVLAASLVPGLALAEHNATNLHKSNTLGGGANTSAQKIPEQIKAKLRQDGFTDVRVIPGSFLVSAKDKNGNKVNMIIGPNSMTMMTEAPAGATGSGGK